MSSTRWNTWSASTRTAMEGWMSEKTALWECFQTCRHLRWPGNSWTRSAELKWLLTIQPNLATWPLESTVASCLSSQVTWAAKSGGGCSMPKKKTRLFSRGSCCNRARSSGPRMISICSLIPCHCLLLKTHSRLNICPSKVWKKCQPKSTKWFTFQTSSCKSRRTSSLVTETKCLGRRQPMTLAAWETPVLLTKSSQAVLPRRTQLLSVKESCRNTWLSLREAQCVEARRWTSTTMRSQVVATPTLIGKKTTVVRQKIAAMSHSHRDRDQLATIKEVHRNSKRLKQ